MRPVSRFLIAFITLAVASQAVALDARVFIEKAVVLIDQGQPVLARSYLEPALIAPSLDDSERSRAYYLRGYSYFEQQLYVSARLDYNRSGGAGQAPLGWARHQAGCVARLVAL